MMRQWHIEVVDMLENVHTQCLDAEEGAKCGAEGGVGCASSVPMVTPQESKRLDCRVLGFCLFRLVQRSSRDCIPLSWRPSCVTQVAACLCPVSACCILCGQTGAATLLCPGFYVKERNRRQHAANGNIPCGAQ